MGQLHLLALVLLTTSSLLANAADPSPHHHHHPGANETSAKSTDLAPVRKEQRLNLGSGLIGLFGGGGGGSQTGDSASSSSSGITGIQQGLKGIQNIQKFISRFQNVMGHPFSFRGLSDTMATMTGLLAAVGGGYLTYVSMVALFGSMMDPHNTAYQTAYSAPPHQYAPPPQFINPAHNLAGGGGQAGAQQGYNRRQSDGGSGLFFGSYDIGKMFQQVSAINYPEASFKLLRIKDESCKQRAVCEFEKFLAKKGVASVILKGVREYANEPHWDALLWGMTKKKCSKIFCKRHRSPKGSKYSWRDAEKRFFGKYAHATHGHRTHKSGLITPQDSHFVDPVLTRCTYGMHDGRCIP